MNIKNIGKYWKAVVGFAAPAASVIALSTLPGGDGGSSITKAEWITAIAAAIITSAGVGATGNRKDTPAPKDGV